MSVAEHLRIRLDEYDARIRTFVPRYDEMLETAARMVRLLDVARPRLVDLGIGTGALSAACARAMPAVAVTGIDADADILAIAQARLTALGVTPVLLHGDFSELPLPACDVVVSSLALHHVKTDAVKQRLYENVRRALRPNGVLLLVDCHPSADAALAQTEFRAWREHVRAAYSEIETEQLFAAWAQEDIYTPLSREIELLTTAGFAPDVCWRSGCFAVIRAV
jgi:tRNA (cmo5U34)-methyltransferase